MYRNNLFKKRKEKKMNKLFTKVAALTLGVAMAAGVGVAVGTSQKASAVEATSYDAVIAKGNNAYDDNTINGKYSIKAGSSSKQGSMTITIPSASAKTLSFYAAAWKGDSTTVDLSSTGVTLSVSSLQLTNDSALTGTGSAWTLNQDEETYLFELNLTDCTANAVVTLTAHTASKNRFFVWSAQYDDGESGDVVDVTGVSLDNKSADLVIPNSTTLTATVAPENATNKKVSWSSSNSLVASVANGIVKAVDQGTATITVTTQDGSFTDECVVTVSLPAITDVTVAQAIEAGAALSDGATSTEYYRVTGYVVAITYEYAQGTMSFTLADEKGGTSTVTCYKFACTEEEATKIVVDARVSLVGNIQNYVKSSVHTYEFVNNIRSQTAFPEEPAADWPADQKTALETALHGYLPPYFGELVEDLTTTENSAVFTVSGDHSAEFAAKLGDGWNLVSDNNYMLVGDNYYLTASIYTYGVRLDVGDYSEFTFAYHEGQPVQKYTVTYTAGQGTGDNYVVSDVEAGSLHALVTFETAAFTAPEGQQFKGWQVGDDTELRAAGYEVTVSGDVTVIAIYEEIPAQKFTITYKSGYGTGDDIVISDVEAGSSHVLKSFDETQFVAPAGQQFKGWRVGSESELRDPGYEITNIQADVNIFANYEDIPVTDWSDAFKTAYTSRFGSTYLPPFVSAEFADENAMYWFDGYPFGYVSVEGNLLSVAISAFNGQWTFVGDAQNAIYIFCDANMNAFVQIVYDTDYGTTDLIFSAIADLALDTTGVKTEYFVGDAVDTTNLTVHPMLFNGTVVPALQLPSSMWTVSPSTFTEAGTQDVTITVSGFFTEPVELPYSVNVAAVVAESISVSGQVTKTSYKAGEEWSAEGLVVTAHYNNGTEADVTDQVTWSFDPAETAVEVTSVSAVAHLGDLSSDAVVFDVVVEQAYDADTFAKDLLEMVAPICANYDGKKNNKVALKTVWDTMSQRYSTLSNEEKAKVIAAAAKADGTDLEKAMAFYNYACKKYGLTKFIEGRQVKALVTEHETGNSVLPIVVIVASSVAAITAIGVVIALKRRKALLAR